MRYIQEDTTLRFRFNTSRFSSGAPFTLAGTPSLAVYPEDSDTQITSGITLTVDNDSKTGMNNVVIDLSASASYTADRAYQVVIEAGTVDSVSVVGKVVYEFFIVAAGGTEDAITRDLLALPAVAPASNGGLGTVDANNAMKVQSGTGANQISLSSGAVIIQSGTGTGQVKLSGGYVAPNWGDVGNPTTTVNLSGTTVKAVTDRVTANADQIAGSGTAATNIVVVYATDFATNYNTTLDMFNVNTMKWGGDSQSVTGLSFDGIFFPLVGGFQVGAWNTSTTTLAEIIATAGTVYDFLTTGGAAIADVPTVAEFNARTLVAASYATAAAQATAQSDLDIITGPAGVVISSTVQISIADNVLIRGVSNVQDTADTSSLAALILATFESSRAGTVWTIRKTGGSTFVVKTLTEDAAATPVTGVT